ncbi:MAG: prepilin-type N-terminal cleavage/methylation domain-containing protein [Planctomycetes bacterium]|nr:prepilin-type N-terminal cleavage/methylation domain-containing protein [Planctomycetota bacterium]
MKRRGFTLIEVAIASVVTTIVAGSVIGTIKAVTDVTIALDASAHAMARLARAEARVADHVNRARMVLSQTSTEVLLWLPTETFSASAILVDDYDAIQGNELAWYVMKPATKTLYLCYLTDRTNRTVYSMNTNWTSLLNSSSVQGKLTEIPVLEGIVSGGFRVESSDPCSVQRFTFDGLLSDELGGMNAQLGGRILNGLRHPDCQ